MAAEARRKVEREFDVAREAQKLLDAIQGGPSRAVPPRAPLAPAAEREAA
jgi:hypothetical protein